MNRSAQELAQNLVDALAEARAVHELQHRRTEAARERADAMQEQVLSLLKAQVADVNSAEAQQQRRHYQEQMRSRLSSQDAADNFTETNALNSRWETAFCDSQLALMRLYAFSEAHASAERIADTLRTLRLIQIERGPLPSPPAPSLPSVGAETLSELERQQQKSGMALNYLQGMDGYHKQVQQIYQEKSARTEMLLKQAHEEAMALARRLKE